VGGVVGMTAGSASVGGGGTGVASSAPHPVRRMLIRIRMKSNGRFIHISYLLNISGQRLQKFQNRRYASNALLKLL
jgi:hypothetical protein